MFGIGIIRRLMKGNKPSRNAKGGGLLSNLLHSFDNNAMSTEEESGDAYTNVQRKSYLSRLSSAQITLQSLQNQNPRTMDQDKKIVNLENEIYYLRQCISRLPS